MVKNLNVELKEAKIKYPVGSVWKGSCDHPVRYRKITRLILYDNKVKICYEVYYDKECTSRCTSLGSCSLYYNNASIDRTFSSMVNKIKVNSKRSKDMKKGREIDDRREWSFNVRSNEIIDFNEISRCLSYASPIALVNAGEHSWVVVHKSISEKAVSCNNRKLEYKWDDLWEKYSIDYLTYGTSFKVDKKDISSFIDLVKKIKACPFKKKVRSKSEVKVILPSV